MTLIDKLKEKGLRGILDAVVRRISQPVNRLAYRYFSRSAIENTQIVLESEGDFCDNAYALYDYMAKNGYLKKYSVIWLVDHPENPRFAGFENTSFVSKNIDRINPPLMKALARCRYYIYDHNCLYSYLGLSKRQGQQIAYLSHGAGFKAPKGSDFEPPFEVLFATGPYTAHALAKFSNCSEDRIVTAGYPRVDFFFREDDPARKVVRDTLCLDKYSKVLLWMPTFRQCDNRSISEDYIQNETGLPMLTTRQQVAEFDKYLQEKNILMILKIHHLQANLPIFREHFQNLMILKDEHLLKMGVQLYQFVPVSDALITDYSTIAIDYLPLNKPIIFTLDDYEEYAKSRGFYPPNAIDYMKGYHTYDLKQLCAAIDEIAEGVDRYAKDRQENIHQFFQYVDGNSAKRILDHLNIQ